MSRMLKLFGFFAVAGLAVNFLSSPTAPSGGPPVRVSQTAPTGTSQSSPASTGGNMTAVSLADSTEGQAAIKRVERCLRANACAYHIVGIGTVEPILQMSVMAGSAVSWAEADFQAAEYLSRQAASKARDNPQFAVIQFDGLPESAPFFPRAVANVEQRLTRYSVAVVGARKSLPPRAGVPGWQPLEDRPQRPVRRL